MSRIMAGGAVTLLLTTGAFLFWQGRAADRSQLPDAPAPRVAPSAAKLAMLSPELPGVPEATAKTREEKRFGRADKDKDGRVTAQELLTPRRKAFAKLDRNGNGTLSFEEWAVKTVDKMRDADRDRSGWLSPAEFRTTAPKPPKKKARCGC